MPDCKVFNIFTMRTVEIQNTCIYGHCEPQIELGNFYIACAGFEVLIVALLEKIINLCYTINRYRKPRAIILRTVMKNSRLILT